MTIEEVIAALERATEGNSWHDMDIARAIGWRCPGTEPSPPHGMDATTISDWWGFNWFGPFGSAQGSVRDFPFTTSVDVALSLIPEGYDYGCSFSKRSGLEAWVQLPFKQGECHQGYAPDGIDDDRTRALAICIAALRARLSTDTKPTR